MVTGSHADEEAQDRALLDVLPPARLGAHLEANTLRTESELRVDEQSIRVASADFTLDERLNATLSWTQRDGSYLMLELWTVTRKTERRELALMARLDDLPAAFARVPLIREPFRNAYLLDGDVFLDVLAAVRGALEAFATQPRWQPRGVQRGLPGFDFVPLRQGDIAELAPKLARRYRVVESGPEGSTVRRRFHWSDIIVFPFEMLDLLIGRAILLVASLMLAVLIAAFVIESWIALVPTGVVLLLLVWDLLHAFGRTFRVTREVAHLPGLAKEIDRRSVGSLRQAGYDVEVVDHAGRSEKLSALFPPELLIGLLAIAWGYRRRANRRPSIMSGG